MSWQIKDFKRSDISGKVAGDFTLEINGMQIRGFTHFKGDDGSEWVKGPQREYQKDGEKKYYQFVYFPDKGRWSKFQKWCLAEISKIPPTASESATDEPNVPF